MVFTNVGPNADRKVTVMVGYGKMLGFGRGVYLGLGFIYNVSTN
jgi:hypothetical protein